MGFPSHDRTLTEEDVLRQARVEAGSARNWLEDAVKAMKTSRISVTQFFTVAGRLAGLRKQIEKFQNTDGVEDMAEEKFNKSLAADATALLAAIDVAVLAIKTMIPTEQKTGILLVCKFDEDYSLAWTAFEPEQMEPVVEALQGVIDAID